MLLSYCYAFSVKTSLTGRVEDFQVVVLKGLSSVTLDISNILNPGQSYVMHVVHKKKNIYIYIYIYKDVLLLGDGGVRTHADFDCCA